MKIVFTSEGVEVPASRYRCMQFFPHFEARGIDCGVVHGYGRLYNRVQGVPLWGSAYKVIARGKRALRTAAVDDADLLFHQRTAFPQTAVPEWIAARRGLPSIFDFDDSIFLGPGGARSRPREKAFRDAVRIADQCIAGNRYLAEVADAPDKTTVIPTVVDTDRYVPRRARQSSASAKKAGPSRSPDEHSDQVVIGWMGTAGNFPFLERVVPALRAVLHERRGARVRIVSNADFAPLSGVERVEQIRWSAAREVELLQSFDVGLMPLVDGPLARGKCAFKMVQYLAVGAPAVVSAVGANVEVMEGTRAGYLLDDFQDWRDALLKLVDDAELRAELGDAGRRRAVDAYSVKSVLPKYLEIFERLRP
jgi:glycosyltransferase involved in cell wall biosynthesis